MVFQGKLRTAVQWITERETGGILKPEYMCKKTGGSVVEVLSTKHPEACPPTATSLDSYPDRPPDLVPVDITNDTVTAVAEQISGGAELGRTESVSLQHWLLHFGAASG